MSLYVVPKGHIENMAALIEVRAGCLTGDKPSYEPMKAQFPVICASPGAFLQTWFNANMILIASKSVG